MNTNVPQKMELPAPEGGPLYQDPERLYATLLDTAAESEPELAALLLSAANAISAVHDV